MDKEDLDTPFPFNKERSSLSFKRKRKLNDIDFNSKKRFSEMSESELDSCKKKSTCKNTERPVRGLTTDQ